MALIKACFVILLVSLFGYNLNAQQLTANFTSDVTSGCSPLTVSFKNTSTGTSPSATYSWDFGNGNASQLPNPSTTYSVARIDTVKLTVTDKGNTSVAEKYITVYAQPLLGFNVIDSIGCLPLSVQFSSTSTTSAGVITSYIWDFGDGSTSIGDSTTKAISHIYNASGKFNVKLAIKTSTGCASTSFVETGAVNGLLTPKADYTRNKTYLCQLGSTVGFTNQSLNIPDH